MQFGRLLQNVQVGDQVMELYLPDENLLRSSYAAGQIHFPYWGKLWPAAQALAQWLGQHPEILYNKKVLELGAGLGLPSLVAAKYAASVLCTDRDAAALKYVQASAMQAGLKNIVTDVVDWTAVPAHLQPDVVLLSDVNYNPNDFAPLLKTIKQFLQQQCSIVLSTPQRLMARPFVEALLSNTVLQDTITIGKTSVRILQLQ